MKVFIILALACMAFAEPEPEPEADPSGYGAVPVVVKAPVRKSYGLYTKAHAENRVREAKVNHYNGRRQLAVNHAAVAYGASDGTAIYNGAPGTGVGGYGYGAYGYGAAPYGAAGYGVGYAAPARAGYGYGGYAGGRVGYGGLGYW